MPGANFTGSTMSFGRNVAEVGKKDVTAQNAFIFDGITSVELKVNEPNSIEGEESSHDSLKKGDIGFTMFFEDPDEHYCQTVPVPVCLCG